jgi:hypothetical protein
MGEGSDLEFSLVVGFRSPSSIWSDFNSRVGSLVDYAAC